MRIAILEDDLTQSEMLRWVLESVNHKCHCFATFKSFQTALYRDSFDLVLLDWVLPDSSGPKVMHWIRETLHIKVPVLFITSKTDEENIVEALNAGADDYLVKPFDLSELSARVAAVARRYRGNPSPIIQVGELMIDLGDHRISRNGLPVELTAREWALFEGFIQRPGMLLSRSQLEDRLYAFGAEIESNTIEVYVSRLRKKLGRDAIVTVRGMGYRLETHGH